MRYNIGGKPVNLIGHGNVSDPVLNMGHLASKGVMWPACNQTSRVMTSKPVLVLVVGSGMSPYARNPTDIANSRH